MNSILWVVAAILAIAFLAAGAMKLAQPKEKLAQSGQDWVENFSPSAVKIIGSLEVLAAVGMVLPALVDTATVVVPLAATGIVLLMIGAAITHVRRQEHASVAVNVVLGGLAAFVAFSRYGTYSF